MTERLHRKNFNIYTEHLVEFDDRETVHIKLAVQYTHILQMSGRI